MFHISCTVSPVQSMECEIPIPFLQFFAPVALVGPSHGENAVPVPVAVYLSVMSFYESLLYFQVSFIVIVLSTLLYSQFPQYRNIFLSSLHKLLK